MAPATSVILSTPSSDNRSISHRAAGVMSFMNSASGGMRGGVNMLLWHWYEYKQRCVPRALMPWITGRHYICKIKESCPHLIVSGSAGQPVDTYVCLGNGCYIRTTGVHKDIH